jgi:TonB family protein
LAEVAAREVDERPAVPGVDPGMLPRLSRAMFRSFVMAFAVLAAIPPAHAGSLPLQPSEKWVVNFAEAQCVASRNYGTKDHPLYLTLKQPAHRSVIQLRLLREGPATEPQQVPVKLQFDNGPEIRSTMLSFYSDSAHLRIFQVNVPIDQFSAGINAGSLRIDGKWLDVRLALSSMPALMQMMDKCVADLRGYWNVVDLPPGAPVGDKSPPSPHLQRDAKVNLPALFGGDDYPWAALVREEGGRVGFSLLIDATGKVADCSIIETSGIASLDAQSCAIVMKRAHFTPAIGLDGKPARDAYIGRVRWVAD